MTPEQVQPSTSSSLTRIAHLSDIHILDETRVDRVRARSYDLSTHFVSIGRPLDPVERRKKLQLGLRAAKQSGAQHFVISGDLTEMGTKKQYDVLAETLHESGVPPWRITLVPGNHDALTTRRRPGARQSTAFSAHGRERARETPARSSTSARSAFSRSTSPATSRRPAPSGISTTRRSTRSSAASPTRRSSHKRVVLVHHHPPFGRSTMMQWIDGLRGWGRLMNLIERFPAVHSLHGHLHHVSRVVGRGRERVFGAPAIVDDPADRPRVRLYDVHGAALESAGFA